MSSSARKGLRMRILTTSGNGFLAGHLVARPLQRGASVRVFGRSAEWCHADEGLTGVAAVAA